MGRLFVVIPALDEEESIGLVLAALPSQPASHVIVVDNGSRDATAERAVAAGAELVDEPRRGYGRACLSGLDALRQHDPAPDDIVAFLDADFSDDPSQLGEIVAPILEDRADLVIGSRVLGEREPGALLIQARWGNWLATRLIRVITGVRFTDLGPFRACRWASFESLNMEDDAFGWTVEMQLKAASSGLRCVEIPVRYRRRVGESKITGTLRGTVLASVTILSILGKWLLGYRPR